MTQPVQCIFPPYGGHGPRYYSRPIEGVNSNLRSPMLNSLLEWGERRSTRVFALKIAQKRLEFEGVCTVTGPPLPC